MKPERIQLTATLPRPGWSIGYTFHFAAFRHVLTFSALVESMGENHGFAVSCSGDAASNELTVKVPVPSLAQASGAEGFLGKVTAIHEHWSSPDEES